MGKTAKWTNWYLILILLFVVHLTGCRTKKEVIQRRDSVEVVKCDSAAISSAIKAVTATIKGEEHEQKHIIVYDVTRCDTIGGEVKHPVLIEAHVTSDKAVEVATDEVSGSASIVSTQQIDSAKVEAVQEVKRESRPSRSPWVWVLRYVAIMVVIYIIYLLLKRNVTTIKIMFMCFL